jgi:hypothetical protein
MFPIFAGSRESEQEMPEATANLFKSCASRVLTMGNKWQSEWLSSREGEREEMVMPVLLLWAVPAVIFVGGVGYFLVRAH